MVAAIVPSYIGLIVVAVFGPLLFPSSSLTDSSAAENGVVALAVVLFLLFGAVVVMPCWKFTLTRRRPLRINPLLDPLGKNHGIRDDRMRDRKRLGVLHHRLNGPWLWLAL